MAAYRDYNTSDTKLVSVRLRVDLFDRIDEIADESGRSRSAIVNELIAGALKVERVDRVTSLENDVLQLSKELEELRREIRSLKDRRPVCIDDI